MSNRDDRGAFSAQIETVFDRFLRGELSLEEAAREIAHRLPKDEPWALTFNPDDAPDDVARMRELIERAAQLWGEMLDDERE